MNDHHSKPGVAKVPLLFTCVLYIIGFCVIFSGRTEEVIFKKIDSCLILRFKTLCSTETHKFKPRQIRDVQLHMLGEAEGLRDSIHYKIEIETIGRKKFLFFQTSNRKTAKERYLVIRMMLNCLPDLNSIEIENKTTNIEKIKEIRKPAYKEGFSEEESTHRALISDVMDNSTVKNVRSRRQVRFKEDQ